MISIQQWQKWMNKGSASIPYALLQHYKKLSITDTEMMLLIHLHAFASEGIFLPSMDELLARMSCKEDELGRLLKCLLKKGVIGIQSSLDQEGRHVECYSLDPLWEQLYVLLSSEGQAEVAAAQETYTAWPDDERSNVERVKVEGQIFQRFEQEFGRPLSPIECETIGLWLDEDRYEPQIIFLALREAVISSKLSLRYIDRILFEWQKSGVKTPEQVREHSKRFRQQQFSKLKPKETSPPVEFTFYNWLEK